MRTGLRLTSSIAGRLVVPCRQFSSAEIKRHQLTSKAIDTTANGDYNWSAFALLQHHEMIRRELARGTTALEHFKLVSKPWHAFCFSQWFEFFMIPTMHEHHTVEDVVFRAAYRAASADVPESFTDDHKGLAKLVEDVSQTAKRLNELARVSSAEALTGMYEQENALKVQYKKLVEFVHAHLAEEEQFYLPVMDKYGEKVYYEIQSRVGEYTLRNFEKSYPVSFCAVMACMGITIRESRLKEEPDKGWAGKALRERVYSRMMPDLRDGLLPEWNKMYTMQRWMIDGIVDEDDIAEIDRRVEQLMGRIKE